MTGLTIKETTTEYALDKETGKLTVVKQKVQQKTLPPNVDLMRVIYQQLAEQKNNFVEMTDEELENEKQRLLKELKENDHVGGKSKRKSKM